MALAKRTQNDVLPGFSNGLLFKDLIDWPQVKTYRSESNFPAVNVKETEKYFEVEVAAPGLKKEDFSIELENDVLSVSHLKKEEKKAEGENGRYTMKEFALKSFKRSFSLPENQIDSEKIEAKYQDGILNIVLPKKEEKKEKVKQIKIT